MYKNIDGLQVSNSVIINGLAVGRVSSISFLQNKENNILVEMDIEGSIVLDDSTIAILISEGFLGGKAIELRLPDSISNPLNDGDTLIVTELSRLGRSTSEVISLINQLVDTNVRTIIIKQNMDIQQHYRKRALF